MNDETLEELFREGAARWSALRLERPVFMTHVQGLLAGTAAEMLQDDRPVVGTIHGPLVDRGRPRLGPIDRVDVPVDRDQAQRSGQRDQ